MPDEYFFGRENIGNLQGYFSDQYSFNGSINSDELMKMLESLSMCGYTKITGKFTIESPRDDNQFEKQINKQYEEACKNFNENFEKSFKRSQEVVFETLYEEEKKSNENIKECLNSIMNSIRILDVKNNPDNR